MGNEDEKKKMDTLRKRRRRRAVHINLRYSHAFRTRYDFCVGRYLYGLQVLDLAMCNKFRAAVIYICDEEEECLSVFCFFVSFSLLFFFRPFLLSISWLPGLNFFSHVRKN